MIENQHGYIRDIWTTPYMDTVSNIHVKKNPWNQSLVAYQHLSVTGNQVSVSWEESAPLKFNDIGLGRKFHYLSESDTNEFR